MSLFPDLFATKPLLKGKEEPSQATKRRLSKYRTSLPGYIVLEGLDFGNRRILREVHAAMKAEEQSGFSDIQNRLSELRYDTRDRWSARLYRSPSAPQYAGRDLLPWENPGETDVSFPNLRDTAEEGGMSSHLPGETRRLVPWPAADLANKT